MQGIFMILLLAGIFIFGFFLIGRVDRFWGEIFPFQTEKRRKRKKEKRKERKS